MGEGKDIDRTDIRVKPDVYMAALLDEVNEHLVEVIEKLNAANKPGEQHKKHYTTGDTAISVATPTEPNSPDTISDPATATPGYQAHPIYETLGRIAPKVGVINDGTDTLYVIATSDAENWTPENTLYPGEATVLDNVYELRLRSPTVGDTTTLTGGVYRITEYEFKLANTGLMPTSPIYGGLVGLIGSANLTTIMAAVFASPMNAEFNTDTPLGAGATFFGPAQRFQYSRLGFMSAIAGSNVASAANGFRIQQSHDAFFWDFDGDAVTTVAGVASRIKGAIAARWARVAYTNGAAAQAIFRLGSRATIS